MAQKFDATTKSIFDHFLNHLVPLSGRRTSARTEIIESDLSAVTAAADKVVLVHDEPPWIFHCEPHTYREEGLPARLNMYNSILEHRQGLLVRTVLLLLRPEADHPELTGVYERAFSGEPAYRQFRYAVVRVWQEPLAAFLSGGVGLLPLAPLSDVREDQLPPVIKEMEDRIQQEARPEDRGVLWVATGLLMGLRYPPIRIEELLGGVHVMKESTYYQYIQDQARVEEGRVILLHLGEELFGPVTGEARRTIQAITELPRLEGLIYRAHTVSSWDELLASP